MSFVDRHPPAAHCTYLLRSVTPVLGVCGTGVWCVLVATGRAHISASAWRVVRDVYYGAYVQVCRNYAKRLRSTTTVGNLPALHPASVATGTGHASHAHRDDTQAIRQPILLYLFRFSWYFRRQCVVDQGKIQLLPPAPPYPTPVLPLSQSKNPY